MPEAYQTLISADGANLSQGQRQILVTARATAADPAVLIPDRATNSINTRTERLIEQGFDALMRNRTVSVIAHRLSTVRDADVLVFVDGQIIERGNRGDWLARRGRYVQLHASRQPELGTRLGGRRLDCLRHLGTLIL